MTRHAPPSTPLFTWQRDRELSRLEAERAALAAHVRTLRPRSYARVVHEARLRELTRQCLDHIIARRAGADLTETAA